MCLPTSCLRVPPELVPSCAAARCSDFVVEFDPSVLSWDDFRNKVLGPTDPNSEACPPDSLRGQINKNWEALGLKAACTTGDNAVHASASPFEGLAEQTNWLQMGIRENSFGKALVEKSKIPEETIIKWSVDPQVIVDENGKKASLFDQLEDKDFDKCLEVCEKLDKLNNEVTIAQSS